MTQAQFIENLAELCDGKDFPKDLLKVIVFGITQYRKISDITILKKKILHNCNYFSDSSHLTTVKLCKF